MMRIDTPISTDVIEKLNVGMQIEIYGRVLCGRDAVLPRLSCDSNTLPKIMDE